MAKKKIGIYSNLESTANNKVEDLYLVVDNANIIFSVKNKKTNEIVAFEHFANNPENVGWHQMVAYLQNNSKLIHGIYGNILFVLNTPTFIVTNKLKKEDSLIYLEELNLVHGKGNDTELYITPYNDNLVIAFTVPDALSTLLSRTFPTGKWHHYVEFVLSNPINNEASIYLFENHYLLSIVKESKQQFIKYFLIEGDDQNSYHILNACQHGNLEIYSSNLKVWGYQNNQHAFIQKIATYFSKAEIVSSPNSGIGVSLNASYPENNYPTYFIF